MPWDPRHNLKHVAVKVAHDTYFWCPLDLAGAPVTCLSHGLALETSRKGGRAQASGKGMRTASPGPVAGLIP